MDPPIYELASNEDSGYNYMQALIFISKKVNILRFSKKSVFEKMILSSVTSVKITFLQKIEPKI